MRRVTLRLATAVGATIRIVRQVVPELIGIAGAGLISGAAWMVHHPAGLAVAGAFLILADWRRSR